MDNKKLDQAAADTPAPFSWPYLKDGTAVNDAGLVIKNVDKVESVNTGIDSRETASFVSNEICRRMRRDFHLISKKMYMRAKSPAARTQIYDLLMELRLQCEFLKAEAKQFAMPQFAYPAQVPFRIVSKEGAMLYRIMCEADLPFGVLTETSKADIIKQEHKDRLLEPFLTAYSDLQRYLTGNTQRSEKSAAQLGSENGIT